MKKNRPTRDWFTTASALDAWAACADEPSWGGYIPLSKVALDMGVDRYFAHSLFIDALIEARTCPGMEIGSRDAAYLAVQLCLERAGLA